MNEKNVLELTNPQKNIWLTEEYYKGTNINNICGKVNINEKINFELLQKAINAVIENNSSFLINFKLIDGNLVQYKTDYHYFDIQIESVNSIDDVKNLEKKILSRVFNIEDSYLFEFKIFRFPDSTGGFILNMHHLLADSWAMGLISKRIIEEYNSLISGKKIENNYFDYFDFCTSEKEYLNSEKFEKDKEYWENQFKNIPEIAELPSSKKSSKELTCVASRKTYEFSKDFVENINLFCRNNKISAFNFLTAIYSLYISRVCNLDDFVIGTPVLNRTNYAEKNTTGMFISTVPLRINISENKSFIEFSKNISTNSMSMLRHQKYPYEFLLKKLREKTPNLPNLYNILISYQITRTITDGLDYSTDWTFNGNCSDDLQIHILDLNDTGKLNISYDYKIDKYEEQDIINFHNRIEFIIQQILKKNNIILNNIEIITKKEKQELLNYNKTDFDIKKSIIEYIEEIAQKNPEKIAIEDENTSINYCELINKVNQTANFLLKKYDLKEKNNIGIFTYRKIDTIIGILAILKINCTFVPIDPEYPIDRIKYMIENSGLKYILTSEKTDIANIELITINNDIINNYSKSFNKNISYNVENNLYIVFTSGSTGNPKGIALKQSNMLNLIFYELYVSNMFKNINNINILQFATMSFDVSYQEIFTALLSAGKLVLIKDATRKNMEALTNYINKYKINTLFIPPAYLRILVEDEKYIKTLSKNLKIIITAGEALVITAGIKKLLKENIQLYNHYGPAETHVATTYLVDKDYSKIEVPIGKPISNCNIYILDKTHNLCPKNVIGEIAISGSCVGNGYWNNENLTKNKFISDSFTNSKMYLTGDLGFIDNNNNINFIGRADFQVKINGFRIEPDEINNCILKFPNIKSAITLIDEYLGKKHIISYYTTNEPNIEETTIINYLKEKMPKYMIPTKIIKLDKMPLNMNGKIDRKLLPKIDYVEKENEIILPQTHNQKILANIWGKIFKLNEVGINYDFFELGGDSLLAIKLISEIKNNFNVDLNISEIYKHSILSDLSQIIENGIKTTSQIHKYAKQEYYPLSTAQKRIYYASKMAENPLLYNVCGGLLINKKLDEKKINNIFNELIKKHSALRTSFKLIDNEPKQIILESAKLDIKINNSETIDIQKTINSFAKPFNLENAPLFSCEIHYIKDMQTLILINSHHIILDGSSLNILINEFCKMYNDETIEAEKIEYTDFTLWENEFNTSPEFKKLEQNWKKEFENIEIPVVNLPYDYPVPTTKTYNGNTVTNQIPEKTFNNIINIAKEIKVSPYVLFLSTFYILLNRYTGQDEIIVGSPISGRFDNSLESTLGMFVNNIPLMQDINTDISFSDFAVQVKNKVLTAIDNGLYPYDMLTKALNIGSNSSLFDIMFIYQNENDELPKIDNQQLSLIYANTKTSKFNLSMEIIPNTNLLNLEYNTDLFKKQTIKRLFEHYINILNSIIDNKNIKIKDIPIISDEEKNLILNSFNNTKAELSDTNIIKLFENQVKRKPDNIAIVFKNETITYKELNKKINSLANYLKFIGISENDRVIIMLNRSIELIIAIYAVIKSGASYVLIDNSLPQERIEYIEKDFGANYAIIDNSASNSLKINNTININNFDFINYNSKNIFELKKNDNLCLIYTSGSTGRPKGVLLHEHGFINLMYAFDKEMNISKYKSILGIASVSFDMFAVELFSSTLFGNTLILADEEEQKNPIAMSKLIIENKVEFMITTPSRIELLLEDRFNNPLRKIKAFQLGGEKLTTSLYNKLKKNTDANIFNGYGPTEITACCTNKLVTSGKITIGKPLSNMQVYICDKNMNLLPIGIAGEICVCGIGVANGYLNNSTATDEKFVKNPFGDGYLYKTGDLGKYNTNGEIEYIGRTDSQIKIRGLRIELSEIETCLNAQNSIENSVVLYNCKNNYPYLIAFVSSNDTINVHNIKTNLEKKLPKYMIPRYIIQLEKFPLTINGKINKKALENTNMNLENLDTHTYVAPKTENQKILCKIWSSLLKIDVGIDDDLFDIGADSLLAIHFKTQLLSYNIDIPYSDIFKYRTIRKLCNMSVQPDKTLSDNTSEEFDTINKFLKSQNDNIIENNLNNILLLGGTGFVGMHIIDSFIKNCTGKIYCIVREKNKTSSLVRFMELLHFYFGNKLDKYINERIFVLNGNILKNNFALSNKNYNLIAENVDAVINTAANVKHYGNSEKFKTVNTDSINIAIKFCNDFNKKLIHISSLSISGNMLMENNNADQNKFEKKEFTENDFYIGQSLDNVYTKSKFDAEGLIFNAIINENLDAQIIRLGNITSRYSDGHFQINPYDNAFASRLKTFIHLKQMPAYLLDNYLEFTPVDSCADAIINIVKNNSKNRYVYHVYNDNHVFISELLKYLKALNYEIQISPEEEFAKIINNILAENDVDSLAGIINDFDMNHKLNYSTYIKISGNDSKKVLAKNSFVWPKIEKKYIKKYIEYLKKINFIDKE